MDISLNDIICLGADCWRNFHVWSSNNMIHSWFHVQLVQLRQTIGRMLGLNISSAISADFEIVSRLEQLILANKHNMASTIPIDASFEELAQAFRQDHGNSVTFDLGKSRSRSRSVSPARKRDTKVY